MTRGILLAAVGFVLVAVLLGCGGAGADGSDGSPDITTGLVAYYPFSGNATDASGNGNHASATTNVTLVADRNGNAASAYEFNGNDSQIVVPSSASSSLETATAAGTMAAWIRLDGYSISGQSFGPILMKATTTGGTASSNPFMYRMLVSSGGIGIALNNWNNGVSGSYSFDTSGSLWYHVASTWDGNSAKFYVDGTLIENQPYSQTTAGDGLDMVIGADSPGFYESFNGTLDEIRIYNRALSAAEIEAVYQAE